MCESSLGVSGYRSAESLAAAPPKTPAGGLESSILALQYTLGQFSSKLALGRAKWERIPHIVRGFTRSPMKSDIEIAQSTPLAPIQDVARQLDLKADELEPYGRSKAKLSLSTLEARRSRPRGKLILVTALTATRAGDGKTVTSIGLSLGLAKLGLKQALCLRQPSLGPTLGIKGGAAGGGHAQVLPMEDINMHLTGDFHAITAANNLLAATVDNHVHFGNELGIQYQEGTFRRVMDLCDRQLRTCEIGLGGPASGYPHTAGFDITAASEIMAIVALARDRKDLRERLERIVVGSNAQGQPVLARELGCVGALEVLLKDALAPNLVQTTEQTPALIHCGPFANIAHGCNSVIATEFALHSADYVVTEAGFAADLGAEKFFDIKCRQLGTFPAASVLVLTCRALKMHGGAAAEQLDNKDLQRLELGFANARTHIENLRKFSVPIVVAINRFPSDTEAELELVGRLCDAMKVPHARSEVVVRGGEGGVELARRVVEASAEGNRPLAPAYDLEDSLRTKIETLAREIYRADGVDFDPAAVADLDRLEQQGFGKLPICVAKTQLSLSDDPKAMGAPRSWRLRVRRAHVSNGAGFVVVLTGKMLLMPGMPAHGAAERIGIDESGRVYGLS